jgi:hypothetical protein
MSNRWFILVISILFLFVFRIWLDDVSLLNKTNRVNNVDPLDIVSDRDFQAYIFPVSETSDLNNTIDLSVLTTLNPHDALSPASLKDYGFFYIFPYWPDSLLFNFQEVAVNYNTQLNTYSSSYLKFQEY